MASINSVHILGNLTRDPEVRYTPKGSAVCDLSLACNRAWYDDQNQKHEETDFIDVTVFGKTAENVGKFVGKGLRLHVQGRLKQDTWEDKTTGQKRSKIKVIADQVTFIDFLEDRQAAPAQAQPRQAAPAPARGQAPARPAPARGRAGYARQAEQSPFVDKDDGDIPY
jgi:single-strand DNA-binding protein